MIEILGAYLLNFDSGFNILRYLTFRTLGGTITALTLSILLGPIFINFLKNIQFSQIIRKEGPQSHLKKSGTPTMGGLIIIASVIISTLIWADLSNAYVWILIIVTILFSIVGLIDDYLKISNKNSKGLSGKMKLLLQTSFALITLIIYLYCANDSQLYFIMPFNKNFIFDISIPLFLLISTFVIVGSSNAVNLTDGLDGLAILPTVLIMGGLGLVAYAMGNIIIADYLYIPHLPLAGELIVVAGSFIGAGIGFLWYNTYPAQVFMGDVGSLTLGAMLGTFSVVLRQEVIFAFMAGVFIMETLSVIIQVLSYRLFKKRIFLMAPIHHHFELKGWEEPKVIVRFWIITFLLVLFALATLKIR